MTQGSAVFSNPPIFRWRLDRWWADGPRALVNMLNPSKAGAEDNDPTIRKLIKMIQALGYPGFTAVNWSPYIATDPKDLQAWRWNYPQQDKESEAENLKLIEQLAPDAAVRIVAWGNHAPRVPRTQRLIRVLSPDLVCFGKTKSGAPIHPMARGRNIVQPGTPLVNFGGEP